MFEIDLRSDTLTRPTETMRRAMAEAEVGDDVFGEDPTVRRLEETAAGLMGKQAALFVASGTMANLVCQMVHCDRGDEMILGDQSHIFYYEQGGSAAVAGIHVRTIPNEPDGTLDPARLTAAVRPPNDHFPRSRLIALENTHNRCQGAPLSAGYMQAVAELAARNGLKVHVDGARIFNAAAALNTAPAQLVRGADSVAFCLSKGLAAPVGSLVCGSRDFIVRARRARKVLGGGMRQSGILAAAGIVALRDMVDRLPEDHHNAASLANGLSAVRGLEVDPARVKTNIVYARVLRPGMSASRLVQALAARGVGILESAPDTVRAVTHYHINCADVDRAVKTFAEVLSA